MLEKAKPETLNAMIKELTASEIEKVLSESYIGRIGCYAKERVYIVPVTYYYDKETAIIYGHSSHGMKRNFLLENPDICFQVDNIKRISNWESVIAWGRYEELSGSDARQASHLVVTGLRELMNKPEHHENVKFLQDMSHSGISGETSVIYRIKMSEKTGRGESDEHIPA